MKKIPYSFRDLLIQTIQSSRSKLLMWEKITIWLWDARTISSAETMMPPKMLPSSTPSWDAANWHRSMCASGWTTSSPISTTMTRTTHVTCWNSFRTISSRRASSDILWKSSKNLGESYRILKISPTFLKEPCNTGVTDGLRWVNTYFSTFKFNRILYVCLSMYMFNLIYHLVLYHTCNKKAVKKGIIST